MRAVLGGLGFSLHSLDRFPDLPDAIEDGADFVENARKKALHYRRLTGMAAVADDSGLEVDALGGWPGVYSARVAPDDSQRIEAVLSRLAPCSDPGSRNARFVCAICCCLAPGELIEVIGTVKGEITLEPRGSGGFGYDPIFLYPPGELTFAEMTPEEKNAVSHRSVALGLLRQRLEVLLQT